jgi:hypothetical protein
VNESKKKEVSTFNDACGVILFLAVNIEQNEDWELSNFNKQDSVYSLKIVCEYVQQVALYHVFDFIW